MSTPSRLQRAPVLRRAATAAEPAGMPVLIAAGAVGRLGAARVAGAISRGLQAGGLAPPELLELAPDQDGEQLRALLERQRFDRRLHLARALLVACAEVSERSLAGSPLFELATRARQAGVPAYAIAGRCTLNLFDARVLDLQLVLQAREERSLQAAGEQLAEKLLGGTASPISTGSRDTSR